MQYETPTNKSQLLTTLKEIYHFYRVQRIEAPKINLKTLAIPKLAFDEKSVEELTEQAQTLILASHQREKNKSTEEIKEKLASLEILIASANQTTQSLIEKITELYTVSQEKIREEGTIKGFATSNVVLDKISQLEEEKNQKITEAIEKNHQQVADYESQKAELNVRLTALDEYFSSLFDKEVQAKVIELNEAQLKYRDEINKYNNTVSEKLLNSQNNVLKAQANLDARYKEIIIPEPSKDMLVDMGYYDDVIGCINSYYSTISAREAYQDLLNDKTLMICLDHYYQDLLYAYKLKASV